jgi:hypothetical protein
MRYALSAAWVLVCLFVLAGLTVAVAPGLGMALAGDGQVASLQENAATSGVRGASQNMSTLPKTAQMRCPAGQLVFLSTACGCNGACCACSQGARYLNHCTCRCEQAPPPPASCRFGFSVGSQ